MRPHTVLVLVGFVVLLALGSGCATTQLTTHAGWALISPPTSPFGIQILTHIASNPTRQDTRAFLERMSDRDLQRLATILQRSPSSTAEAILAFAPETVNLHAPIDTWNQLIAYDTAAECEQNLRTLVLTSEADARDAAQRASFTAPDAVSVITYGMASKAKCVPMKALYPGVNP